MRIRIQFRIRIHEFDDQKIITYYSLIKNYYFLGSKLAIYHIYPRPQRRASKLQEKPPALKRERKAAQNNTFLYFFLLFVNNFCSSEFGSAFPARIRIKPTKINTDPCGSGSGGLKSTRIRIHNIGNYCNLIWLYYYFRRELQETKFRDPSLQSKNMRTFVSRASCNIYQSK
jgi:hypothetical protein